MRGFIALATILLLGCHGGSNCTAGTEGCECTPAGYCDPPNTCESGICVPPAEDTSTDTPVDTVVDTATDDFVGEVECSSDGECDDGNPCTVDSCDLDYNECVHGAVDADGDGYPAMEVEGTECTGGTDCQDDNTDVYPGTAMIECSVLDNDCNGNPDNDQDGDGHVTYACAGGDDCRDGDGTTLLGECEGVNECCDGCWQRNGCWLDPTTGYLWEDPPMGGVRSWDSAVAYCAALSLAGRGAGQWHLPTISELRTLVRGCPATEDGGACGVTDSCLDTPCYHDCGGCGGGGGPGAGGCYLDPALEGLCECYYWSGSSHAAYPYYAWIVYFGQGYLDFYAMSNGVYVRCVSP